MLGTVEEAWYFITNEFHAYLSLEALQMTNEISFRTGRQPLFADVAFFLPKVLKAI